MNRKTRISSFAQLCGLSAGLMLALTACMGDIAPFNGTNGGGGGTADAPCTDYKTCCPAAELKCEGDIDGTVICTCDSLWDCSKNPDKCERNRPEPPGGGDWNCTWSEQAYNCSKKGDKSSPPSGGNGWNCSYSDAEQQWVCTTTSPNPTNKPNNKWKCTVDNPNDTLKCEKIPGNGTTPPNTPPTTPDTPPSTPPPPPKVPPGGWTWNCTTNAQGIKVCTTDGGTPNGPGGGGTWNCHLAQNGFWICNGENVPNNPNGGGGWQCTQLTKSGKLVWVCKKPNIPNEDTPPGGGNWACQKGSEVGGTKCEETDKPPTPPGFSPPPGGDSKCIPGTKKWCDGLVYCGWGQMTCKADGTWPTKIMNGKVVYDCKELSNGARPNTMCACYFFYFNGDCCERADCIVPQGTQPQVCAKSPGKLCDYCNPQTPECVGAGNHCVVTNKGESFCGQQCGLLQPCPNGYNCKALNTKSGTLHQCVPNDSSCYY